MTTVRRWRIGRRSPGRRLLAVVAIAALTMGCVADTSTSVLGQEAAAHPGQVPTHVTTSPIPAPAAVTPAPTATPAPRTTPYIAPAATPHPVGGGSAAGVSDNVPILYYHRVRALPADYKGWSATAKRRFTTYDTLPQAFAAQLDWLAANGYTTILPRDLAAHWDTGAPLPAKPVIISLDDGSHDWIKTVLPMLQERGMVAEFYLTLDAIKFGNLTWKEARRLAAAGNAIGAHDVHHVQLAALGADRPPASEATMWAEVSEARRIIGVHVGVFPDSMAYVGGGYDATLERLVAKAGYASARSINRGIVQDISHRYRMRVVRVGVHDDVTSLTKGTLAAGLPTFTKRMAGVPDR
jgi:peptidoglycan/xylan/chitin deacetylase (PgdA/CDA1 family)